jgi:serine/threonine-protein kinase RsbW
MAFFQADLKNLSSIRTFVELTARELQADQAAIDDMVQAVDEAATNIITHGYAGNQGRLEIDVKKEDRSLVVYLRDGTVQFDPTKFPPPDLSIPLEERPPGGLGIYLINQCVDKLRYRALPQGGNELILVKKAF